MLDPPQLPPVLELEACWPFMRHPGDPLPPQIVPHAFAYTADGPPDAVDRQPAVVAAAEESNVVLKDIFESDCPIAGSGRTYQKARARVADVLANHQQILRNLKGAIGTSRFDETFHQAEQSYYAIYFAVQPHS